MTMLKGCSMYAQGDSCQENFLLITIILFIYLLVQTAIGLHELSMESDVLILRQFPYLKYPSIELYRVSRTMAFLRQLRITVK